MTARKKATGRVDRFDRLVKEMRSLLRYEIKGWDELAEEAFKKKGLGHRDIDYPTARMQEAKRCLWYLNTTARDIRSDKPVHRCAKLRGATP